MKTKLALLLSVLALAGFSENAFAASQALPNGNYAEINIPAPYQYTPAGYFQESVTGTAFSLSSIVPSGALVALVTVEGAVRWRDDGTAPTATVGMPIASGASVVLQGGQLSKWQVIAQTGTVTVDITFEK